MANSEPTDGTGPTLDELLRLSSGVAHVVAASDTSVLPGQAPNEQEIPTHHAYTLAIYMRARSLHESIASSLLPHRQSTEAMVLGRPLFEESLRLEYMARTTEPERAGLVLAFVNESLVDEMHLAEDLERIGFPNLSGGWAILGTQQEKLQAYARRHGFVMRPFPQTRSMAEVVGRRTDFAAYLVSHRFVHGTQVATLQRLGDSSRGTVALHSADTDDRFAGLVAIWASRSTLLALRSAASILDWALPSDVDELLDRCNQLQHPDHP